MKLEWNDGEFIGIEYEYEEDYFYIDIQSDSYEIPDKIIFSNPNSNYVTKATPATWNALCEITGKGERVDA